MKLHYSPAQFDIQLVANDGYLNHVRMANLVRHRFIAPRHVTPSSHIIRLGSAQPTTAAKRRRRGKAIQGKLPSSGSSAHPSDQCTRILAETLRQRGNRVVTNKLFTGLTLGPSSAGLPRFS
jgi:hypothetical protein